MTGKDEAIWRAVLLVLVVAAGLAARLYEADYSFDGDEIFSVNLASRDFSEVIQGSLHDRPHPPLHNVLLHLWVKVFGQSEISVRGLSVLFSAAFLAIAYRLLCRVLTAWLSLGLLSILALSPLMVYFGQQARPYALIALLAAANLLAFVRVMEDPDKRKRIAIWAASCALLLYAQYLAALFIAMQGMIAIWYLRSRRVRVLVYGFVGSVLILPWALAAMGGAVLSGSDPLSHVSWIAPPSPNDFVWFYVSIFGAAPGLNARWLLLLLAFLGIAYIRQLLGSRKLSSSHALLLVIGIGLPVVVYIVSVLGPKPVFADRQMLGAAIAFVAIIGLCMETLPRTAAAAVLLILGAWTALALPQAFPHNNKPPWRDIAAQIDQRVGPLPVVAQEGWVKHPLDYYRKSGRTRLLSDLGQSERNESYLYVCRPVGSKCSDVEQEALKSRRTVLADFRWGVETSQYNHVRIYEIRRASELN